jgi:hypothetical protein
MAPYFGNILPYVLYPQSDTESSTAEVQPTEGMANGGSAMQKQATALRLVFLELVHAAYT